MDSYDLLRRDEDDARLEAFRLKRDGYIVRSISRYLPPTAGTAESASVNGSQPHPAAGDLHEQEQA